MASRSNLLLLLPLLPEGVKGVKISLTHTHTHTPPHFPPLCLPFLRNIGKIQVCRKNYQAIQKMRQVMCRNLFIQH